MNIDDNHPEIQPRVSRRNLVALLGAATVATPAAAFVARPVDEPDLPAWWRKLTGASAEVDPEVFAPWRDTVLTRQLATKIEELHELLLLMGVPAGVDAITDLRMHWTDGVPHNVIVTGRSGAYGEGLHCYRPEFGWFDKTPRIGGA